MSRAFKCIARSNIGDLPSSSWNSVVDLSGAPFFYRHEFLESLQTHPLYETDDSMYVMIEEHDRVVALLPIYLVRQLSPLTGRAPDTSPAEKTWVTHLPHWYDTWLPTTVRVGRMVELLDSMMPDLGISSLTFQNVGSPALVTAFRHAGHACAAQDVRYNMRLSDYASYDAWLAGRGKSTRRNLRRAVIRAKSEGWHRSVTAVTRPEADRVVDLCRISTAKHGNIGWLPREVTIAFIKSLPVGTVVLHQIANQAGTVAGAVGFVDHGTYHSWSGGVDSSILAGRSIDANALLYVSEIAFCYHEGLTFIEGGRRSGEIKTRLGMSETTLHSIRVVAK